MMHYLTLLYRRASYWPWLHTPTQCVICLSWGLRKNYSHETAFTGAHGWLCQKCHDKIFGEGE